MERQAWRMVFAYTGLAVIGLALAFYGTAVAQGGIAASITGRHDGGSDLLTTGSAALLVGVAVMAAFGYLALRNAWRLLRPSPR